MLRDVFSDMFFVTFSVNNGAEIMNCVHFAHNQYYCVVSISLFIN